MRKASVEPGREVLNLCTCISISDCTPVTPSSASMRRASSQSPATDAVIAWMLRSYGPRTLETYETSSQLEICVATSSCAPEDTCTFRTAISASPELERVDERENAQHAALLELAHTRAHRALGHVEIACDHAERPSPVELQRREDRAVERVEARADPRAGDRSISAPS